MGGGGIGGGSVAFSTTVFFVLLTAFVLFFTIKNFLHFEQRTRAPLSGIFSSLILNLVLQFEHEAIIGQSGLNN